MSEDIAIKLEERTILGKGLGALRGQGRVPAVIHDHGKESIHVAGDFVALTKAYGSAGKHHPVQLTLGSKRQLALIKDVDIDPIKHRLRHVVFQAIKQDEKTTAEIPVVLAGEEIPAAKKSLLILTQTDTVEVEALPKDLPDELKVDATVLEEVGDRIHVSDIKLPAGVTILTDPELTVAVVEMPKDQIAEADAAAAEMAEAGAPEAEEGAEAATESPDAKAKEESSQEK